MLGFEGVRTIEDAEALRGLEVLIPGSAVAELDEDAAYIHELVGCILYNGPVKVGTISEVQFMTSADGRRRLDEAAPLLVVSLNGEELLIPFVKAFLASLDLERRRVVMSLPEGLISLNLSPEPTANQKRNAKPMDTTG